jgi:uncharacterized protein YjbI with pentapeptide repeats
MIISNRLDSLEVTDYRAFQFNSEVLFKGEGIHFRNFVDFSQSTFENCTFKNVQFTKCSFTLTKFENCTFENCTFVGCTFWGAQFINSPIWDAVITCCVGDGKEILNIINRGWITITRTHIDLAGTRFNHVTEEDEPEWWDAHPDYSRVYELIDENFN